jgi:hypothetical protein
LITNEKSPALVILKVIAFCLGVTPKTFGLPVQV